MKRTIFVTTLLLIWSATLLAQTERWVYHYDAETEGDQAHSIAYGPDGNTYVAGCRSRIIFEDEESSPKQEFSVISLDPQGNVRWSYFHDVGGANIFDEAKAVIYAPDGYIYAAGTTYNAGSGYGYDITVVKFEPDGTPVWSSAYRSALYGADGAYDLVYANGSLYIAGDSPYGNEYVFTLMRLVDLQEEYPTCDWTYRYNVEGAGRANSLICDSDGNICATGNSNTAADFDFVIVSVTSSGDFNWDYVSGANNGVADDGCAITVDPDNNVYAAGHVYDATNDHDLKVISLESDGDHRWTYTYNDGQVNGIDQAKAIIYGSDENLYVAGEVTTANAMDFAVISLPTSSANARWVTTINGSASAIDRANDVVYGSDGNIYTAGYTTNTYGEASAMDFTVASLRSSDGGVNWPTPYVYNRTPPGNQHDEAYALAYGLDGDIYAAGYSTNDNEPPDYDFTVIRINPASGLFAGSTEPSSGRHLGRELGTTKLHAVYHTAGENVCYSYSADGGDNWTAPELVDQGIYPSVGVLSLALPIDMPPVVVYLHGDELRYRYRDPFTQLWGGFTICPPYLRCSGPPSVYVTGTTVHVAYPVEIPEEDAWGIYYNAFEYSDEDPGTYEEVETNASELTKPSLVCDGDWYHHVIYEKSTRLEYAYRDPQSGWQLNRQISNYPGDASYQPFIDYWGDYVWAPWSEILTDPDVSDIYHSSRYLTTNANWASPASVTETEDYASESPVIACDDAFCYAEHNTANSGFDIEFYRRIEETRNWVEQTTPRSYWPHNQLYYSPFASDMLYVLWTEGSSPGYFVRFKSTDMSGDWGGEQKVYYPVTCGEEKQSAYCVSRTGFRKIGDYCIDHGDSLVYYLHFLDPRYDFVAKIAGLHNGTTTWAQTISADNQIIGSIQVPPTELRTLTVKIPYGLYEKDHAIRLVFKKTAGSYAFCQNIKLYRNERQRKFGDGGGQATTSAPVTSKFSLDIAPNPTSRMATIVYSLPSETRASLRVFDISGRMVRKLYDGKQTAGKHSIIWDGQDNNGRVLPNGVYFLDLDIGSHKETRKVLLLR